MVNLHKELIQIRRGQLLPLPGEILTVGGESCEPPPGQMLVQRLLR